MRLLGRGAVLLLVLSRASLEQIIVPWYVLEGMAQHIFAVRLRASRSNAVRSPKILALRSYNLTLWNGYPLASH